MKSIYRLLSLPVLASICHVANAEVPSNYYSSCENLSGKSLLTALYQKINNHTVVSYDGLWDVYETSDVYPDGKVWDIYSTKHWPLNSQHCGNYRNVGDCYNREHSVPQSWFNDRAPMKSDAFQVYPTDGKVNGQRSNYPYGECAGGTTLPSNNGIRALGRLGSSTFNGYSGTVFEPDNEYKGDLARTYFYMAACYNSGIGSWNSPMLDGSSFPVFTNWAINMLLKWHREDPVSSKELDRNEAIYNHQHNRNPFIDYPELAEHIWGEKTNVPWTASGVAAAEIILPVNGTSVNAGAVSVGREKKVSIIVKGKNIAQNVNLSTTGSAFSVQPPTLTPAQVNTVDGSMVTVTVKSSAAGTCTGTLKLVCGSLSTIVYLSATAYNGLPAGEATNVSDRSFTANWTYVGDADSNGCYTIKLTDSNTGETSSVKVNAESESYDFDMLAPLTEYEYTVYSQSMVSNAINVVTHAPIPDIQLLYDGDLFLESTPGEASPAYELIIDAENISETINVEVDEPFALSSDKSFWSTSISVFPDQERFYIHLLAETPGNYSTLIRLEAGDYVNHEIKVSGRVVGNLGFEEDFEADADGCDTYNGCFYNGNASSWHLVDAGIWAADKSYANSGVQAVRMGKTAASVLEMTEDKAKGIGTVTLMSRIWSNSDGSATFHLECSTDGGENWFIVSADTEVSELSHRMFTFTVNEPGDTRLRICQTAGKRFLIDDITITDCATTGIDGVESNYHSWDAFCRAGSLVIESATQRTARVYGVDGIVYFEGNVAPGTTVLDVHAGIYVVAIDDFTRSVLITK